MLKPDEQQKTRKNLRMPDSNSSPYQTRDEAELRALLADYQRGNDRGIFTRKIFELTEELERRAANVTLAIDERLGVIIEKVNGVVQVVRVKLEDPTARYLNRPMFSKGDRARLKSGGPRMTVRRFDADGKVLCSWHDGDSFWWDIFQPECLERIERT